MPQDIGRYRSFVGGDGWCFESESKALAAEAVEFIAVNGLAESLPLPQSMLIYIPLLSIVLTAVIAILNISAWLRKYWTVAERLHYTLLTAALLIFAWLSFTLNLMPTFS